jgi:hypothetical protein
MEISEPMLRKALVFFLIAIGLVGSVQGLALSNINFGDVEPSVTYTQTLILTNSPQDIDNHFVIEVGGIAKDWITVSPSEFDLAKGASQPLIVTFIVPKEASLGEKTATITAVGKTTVPSAGGTPEGATVGYAVATKSNLVANVVKAGSIAAIEITEVETSKDIKPGDIVKFTISAKNAGNVPAVGQFSVSITKDTQEITTIPSVPVDFGINAEQTVKIYWDTVNQTEGLYSAVVSVLPSSSGKDVKIRVSSYPAIWLELGGVKDTSGSSSSLNLTTIAIMGICLIAVIGIVFFILKRRNHP